MELGSTEAIVLGVLARRPASGYDLRGWLERGGVYLGYLQAALAVPEVAIPRRVYRWLYKRLAPRRAQLDELLAAGVEEVPTLCA